MVRHNEISVEIFPLKYFAQRIGNIEPLKAGKGSAKVMTISTMESIEFILRDNTSKREIT